MDTRLDRHGHEPDDSNGCVHRRHHWMMLACCIPMLVIAVALVAAGVARPSFLLVALMCTVMMAAMIRGMDSEGGPRP